MLGYFFLVGAEVGFQGAVFGFVGGALAGAGDGAVLDFRAGDADEELGGGADDVGRPAAEVQAEVEHVGAGVDDAEGAVDVEGGGRRGVQSKRWEEEDALEDVAGGDVVFGGFDGGEECLLGGAGDELEGLGRGGGGGVGGGGEGAGEECFKGVEAGEGGGVGVTAGEVGGADEDDLVADVVHG